METYTLRGLQSMLGISRAVIGSLIATGFVTPSRGKRNEYRFTLPGRGAAAHRLQPAAAKIAPRKILRSLQRLRATLPARCR